MRLFVSYHTPDTEIATRITELLESARRDLSVFIAPREMAGGGLWVPKLAEELARSDVVIFLAGSRIGPWQEIEYYEAQRLSRSPAHSGRPQIIPVVIAPRAPGLPFFGLLQQIFAKDPTTPETISAMLRAIDGVAQEDRTPAWTRFNPYKGLPAFTSSDSAFFYGREQLTCELLEKLIQYPNQVIALIGKSGVGKSSLAQAGIIAALRSQIWPISSGTPSAWPDALSSSRDWAVLAIRPEDQPLKELARQFLRLVMKSHADIEIEAGKWAKVFGAPLEPGEPSRLDGLFRSVKALLEEIGIPRPTRFLLYVDQAEEIYSRNTQEIATRFTELLSEAAQRADCQVMLSLRSDYYGELQADPALFATIDDTGTRRTARIDIPPLDRATLQIVIEKPAEQFAVRFMPEGLPKLIAASASREAGFLPLVSYLLSDIWSATQARGDGVLRWEETPELFDIAAPLRARAERFLREHPEMQDATKRLFTLRLTLVPRDGDPMKRRARIAECSQAEWRIAEMLAEQDWRLITVGQEGADAIAEVAHEQILRKWDRLTEWLEERRSFLSWKAEVEAARADYDATPAPEKCLALLSGRALLIARQWFHTMPDSGDIAPAERAFVEASIARHDQLERAAHEREIAHALEREAAAQLLARRTTLGMMGAFVLASGAGAAAIWAFNAEKRFDEEQQQRRLAEARSQLNAILAEANRTDIEGQLIAYAATKDTHSFDVGRSGQNSPYTAALINMLRQKELSISQALNITNKLVLEDTGRQQKPFLSSDMNGDIFVWHRPSTRRIFALIVSASRWGDLQLVTPEKDAKSWVDVFSEAKIDTLHLHNASKDQFLAGIGTLNVALTKESLLQRPFLHKVGAVPVETVKGKPNTLAIFIYSGAGVTLDGESIVPLWPYEGAQTALGITVPLAAGQIRHYYELVKERSIAVSEISSRLSAIAAASILILDTEFWNPDARTTR